MHCHYQFIPSPEKGHEQSPGKGDEEKPAPNVEVTERVQTGIHQFLKAGPQHDPSCSLVHFLETSLPESLSWLLLTGFYN